MPSRDDSLAEEGAEHGGQLLHALRSAGQGLCDRVQLDAKEGQALGRPLRLVGVHDQAELTNDRLREEQVAGHVFLRLGDDKEVVEVADVVDALLGEGEMNDRQQLRAHAWRGAQAEGACLCRSGGSRRGNGPGVGRRSDGARFAARRAAWCRCAELGASMMSLSSVMERCSAQY